MKLYLQAIILLFRKFILKRDTGIVVKDFAEHMGIAYIKLAQILATQNFGNLFSEHDRQLLSSICDDCTPISYAEVEATLRQEYGPSYPNLFRSIDPAPVGSASISQVHYAALQTGEEVAIKIKRKDIARTIEQDLTKLKKLIHRFGRFAKFKNFPGSDYALDLYLEWIRQETDFLHEATNLQKYRKFADNVNGKVRNTTQIKIPKLYPDYCTANIIVMEFIKAPTINRMELTATNKAKIATGINSYLKLSFWALFHDQPVIFHGDPHTGNVCIDEVGNIYFLDLGLLCAFDAHDADLCRQLFFAAYSRNYEKLTNLLIPYGHLSDQEQLALRTDCQKYCQNIKGKEITYYFVDMINVCMHYEIIPPRFLFSMAKPFVCLNGINNIAGNQSTAQELLQTEVLEYLVRRSLTDCQDVITDSLRLIPNTILETLRRDPVSSLAQAISNRKIKQDLSRSLANFQELLNLI